jgi:hypothetical protein
MESPETNTKTAKFSSHVHVKLMIDLQKHDSTIEMYPQLDSTMHAHNDTVDIPLTQPSTKELSVTFQVGSLKPHQSCSTLSKGASRNKTLEMSTPGKLPNYIAIRYTYAL